MSSPSTTLIRSITIPTYIKPEYYIQLEQNLIPQAHNLQVTLRCQQINAHVQERLELQACYARYNISNELSPYLLQCIL